MPIQGVALFTSGSSVKNAQPLKQACTCNIRRTKHYGVLSVATIQCRPFQKCALSKVAFRYHWSINGIDNAARESRTIEAITGHGAMLRSRTRHPRSAWNWQQQMDTSPWGINKEAKRYVSGRAYKKTNKTLQPILEILPGCFYIHHGTMLGYLVTR